MLSATGRFEQVDNNGKVLNSGTFALKEENSSLKVILKYSDGKEEELLYANVNGVRTLHYSLGRQVYKNAEDIK